MTRQKLASDIGSGLAGWFQLQLVQGLGELAGEDSARFVAAQVVNAQGRFAPATSQLPPNWGSTKKRVDIAIKGRNSGEGWYGAVEIKWPGSSFDPHQVRLQIVQDAMRLAFISTGNLNAHLLVVGGSTSAIQKLFDTTHPDAPDRESRRIAFNQLLQRQPPNVKGRLTAARREAQFLGAGGRIPDTVLGGFDGQLKCQLLSADYSTIAGTRQGAVFVWQCNRTRGTATEA